MIDRSSNPDMPGMFRSDRRMSGCPISYLGKGAEKISSESIRVSQIVGSTNMSGAKDDTK